MFEFNPDNIGIYSIENIEDIPIIDNVLIDEYNYGRIDIICIKYYNDIVYLPLLLDFNNISDISEILLNQVIKVPDLNSLLNNLVEIDDTLINGIVEDYNEIDKEKYFEELKIKRNNSSPVTNALPKLNIIKDKVKYDDDTGKITF